MSAGEASLRPEKLANKGQREEGEPLEGKKYITLCGSKNYQYLHHRMNYSLDPPPLWKFQSSFIHLLKIFGPLRTLHPQGILSAFSGSVGGLWISSGAIHCAFGAKIYSLLSFKRGCNLCTCNWACDF